MESKTQELSLNCSLLAEFNLISKTMKKTKNRRYIIVTLDHGCSSKIQKHEADVDANGNAMFTFKDVNVETAYLCFQVFSRRNLFADKHVGDVNVLVSDFVLAKGQQPSSASATYELKKTSKKGNKGSLQLSYMLSNVGNDLPAAAESSLKKTDMEQKQQASAIGNDITLFKTVPSYRTPLVSMQYN